MSNCDTCKFHMECEHSGITWCRIRNRQAEHMNGGEGCEDHIRRDASELEDELAAACDRAIVYLQCLPIVDSDCLSGRSDRQGILIQLREALACYQKETGHARILMA